MSLVELHERTPSAPPSGGGMDRVVVSKRIDKRVLIAGGAVAALLLILAFWLLAPRSDSQSVARDRLAIGAVESGVFEDFMPLRARVTPLVTVYLDAVEGGRVDQMLIEDGAQVVKGQLLAANNATFTGANGSLISFKDQAQYDSVGHINSSGIVHIAGQPVVVQQNQSIGGSGTIEGNVTNNGTIAPGASPGALEINGSYTQAATGSLLMEIAGTDAELFDTLSATGPASLDGLLNVALLDGFVPSASDSFRILSASSVSGTFDNVVGGTIAFSDGQFNVAYSPSGVTLSNFAPVPEPGAFALIGLAMTTAIARRRRA